MYKVVVRKTTRDRRRAKIRATVVGTPDRPRLCVFRSNKAIYAQIIDDSQGITLASSVSIKGDAKINTAAQTGSDLAKKALALNIKKVRFDRSGYLYHGRVKSLVEAARKEGLEL